MEQLYDVFWSEDKKTPDAAKFMMRAPGQVIYAVLELPDGFRRMLRETEDEGGVCKLYTNGHPKRYGDSVFVVTSARNTLGEKR